MTQRTVFLNLPVDDVDKSREFFTQLGFSFDERFQDDKAVCMVLSEHGYVMLLQREFFKTFTSRTIADRDTVEGIFALTADSREGVDDLADKAMAAGATPAGDPSDQGFMYMRSFHDLDGHMWEIFWMDPNFDPSAAQEQPQQEQQP